MAHWPRYSQLCSPALPSSTTLVCQTYCEFQGALTRGWYWKLCNSVCAFGKSVFGANFWNLVWEFLIRCELSESVCEPLEFIASFSNPVWAFRNSEWAFGIPRQLSIRAFGNRCENLELAANFWKSARAFKIRVWAFGVHCEFSNPV